MGRFNVLGEVAWLPMVGPGPDDWSMRTPVEVLSDPGRYAALQFAHPLHTAAAWRWLLALAVRASDVGGIDAYAQQWWDRCYLDDARFPFAQRPELEETLERNASPSGLSRLDSRRAKGNNAVLWDHTMADTQLRASPAEIVPMLLWTMACAVGGNITPTVMRTTDSDGKPQLLKGSKSAPSTAPIKDLAVAIAYGDTFADTLACAMAEVQRSPGDAPLWERDDEFVLSKADRTPAGPLDYLTWPSRQNLLDWTGDTVTGAVSTPGWGPTSGADRLALDPTLIPVVDKPSRIDAPPEGTAAKPLHSLSARKWVAAARRGEAGLDRPRQFAAMDGPINIDVIWQGTDQGKYTGLGRETVHFAEPDPPETEEPDGS